MKFRLTDSNPISGLQGKGLSVKASRFVYRIRKHFRCATGRHPFIIDWNTPTGELAARCGWCGINGPWRRVP